MTELAYFSCDDLTMQAVATRCAAVAEGFEVSLDKTLFHFKGGGQPADAGWISNVPVRDVQRRGGDVVHIMDQAIPIGIVALRICGETRLLHSRLHSAGHLIGSTIEELGYKPIKAHHWPGDCRIHCVSVKEGVDVMQRHALQDLVNKKVYKNMARKIQMVDGRRCVSYGEEAGYLCGGTHVQNTKMIGFLEILSITTKKSEVLIIDWKSNLLK